MIDIHAHILPGIDDGAEDMYDTLEMARMAADSGVNRIIATPHCNIPGMYGNYFGREYIDRYESVVRAVRKEKIPIEILPGMEVFSTEDLPELIVNQKIMPLQRTPYMMDVYEELSREYSENHLDVLFQYNPARICDNREILRLEPVPYSGRQQLY